MAKKIRSEENSTNNKSESKYSLSRSATNFVYTVNNNLHVLPYEVIMRSAVATSYGAQDLKYNSYITPDLGKSAPSTWQAFGSRLFNPLSLGHFIIRSARLSFVFSQVKCNT